MSDFSSVVTKLRKTIRKNRKNTRRHQECVHRVRENTRRHDEFCRRLDWILEHDEEIRLNKSNDHEGEKKRELIIFLHMLRLLSESINSNGKVIRCDDEFGKLWDAFKLMISSMHLRHTFEPLKLLELTSLMAKLHITPNAENEILISMAEFKLLLDKVLDFNLPRRLSLLSKFKSLTEEAKETCSEIVLIFGWDILEEYFSQELALSAEPWGII